MIIVITNRKLPEIPNDQPISIAVSALGSILGDRVDDEDIIHTGMLSRDENKIKFYPKGHEGDMFSAISQDDRKKPWVFFVHGFNQTPLDNIDKARALSAYHGVNVVAFAWPSRPLNEAMDWDDAWKNIITGLLSGLSGSAILVGLAKLKAKSFLKDKWKNYPPAIKNAEESNVDLLAALELVKSQLKSDKPPVLLVHSMGNYLLEKTMGNINELPMKFSNIILHQADATSPGYTWVKKLNSNLDLSLDNPAKAYITINAPDYVLGASTMRRAILRKTSKERIGQIRFNHLDCGFNYLDFTDGEWVDNEHEFFQLPKDKTNDHVYECLHRIFKGKSDELPVRERESNVGFTRIPTKNSKISLYRLEYIIHPADDELDNYTSLQDYDSQQGSDNNDLNDPDTIGDD